MVALEPLAKPLLFLHLVAAACVAGAAVHLVLRVWGYLRGRFIKTRLEKVYAQILVVSYAVCYLLGALIYPTFRVHVRAAYFDAEMPWATGLFEAKEHLATLGLVTAVGVWLLSLAMGRPARDPENRLLPLYGGLVAIVLAIVAYNVWSGWYLTTLQSV